MKLLTLSILLAIGLNSNLVTADEGPAWSYTSKNPNQEVDQAVSTAIGWAEGEYEEHVQEGLFKEHPAEGQLILDMIKLAKKTQAQATDAMAAGEIEQARASYFAAEATAQYAARMPHMLEARLGNDDD